MYNLFESLVENSESVNLQVFNPDQSQVENDRLTNGIGPIQPTHPIPGQLPRLTPQWGQTIEQRVASIEKNMVTKQDMADFKEEIATNMANFKQEIATNMANFKQEINAKLDQLANRLK